MTDHVSLVDVDSDICAANAPSNFMRSVLGQSQTDAGSDAVATLSLRCAALTAAELFGCTPSSSTEESGDHHHAHIAISSEELAQTVEDVTQRSLQPKALHCIRPYDSRPEDVRMVLLDPGFDIQDLEWLLHIGTSGTWIPRPKATAAAAASPQRGTTTECIVQSPASSPMRNNNSNSMSPRNSTLAGSRKGPNSSSPQLLGSSSLSPEFKQQHELTTSRYPEFLSVRGLRVPLTPDRGLVSRASARAALETIGYSTQVLDDQVFGTLFRDVDLDNDDHLTENEFLMLLTSFGELLD